MTTLRRHTHLQATHTQAHTKACKRVCLPNRTTDRQLDDRKEQRRHNSTYPKGGVSCSKDSFVVNQTLVFQIKFCGKSPALRLAANRYRALNKNLLGNLIYYTYL
jgi:hypothetical protein